MNSISPLLLLLTASLACAETHDELVERAFASMEPNLRDFWSFTETTDSGEGVYVARFDPRLPEGERWDLLTVDDREPTEDEHEEFQEEKESQRGSDSDGEDSETMSVVADGSLELLDESDAYWRFRFRPKVDSDDEEKFMAAVEGTLQVVKDGHYVSWVRMRNHGTIKPGKGVKLEVFDAHLAFAPAYEGGPVLPDSVATRVKGRAMLVIRFDEEERIFYSDFKRVID